MAAPAAPRAALPVAGGATPSEVVSPLSDSRAASAAAGAVRGAPRRRSDELQLAAACGTGGADAVAAAAPSKGAHVDLHVEAPPQPPPATTVEGALAHHAKLVNFVLAQVPELQLYLGADEAVATALRVARWDAAAVAREAKEDTTAWRTRHGLAVLATAPPLAAFMPCALCPDRGGLAQLTCGHALCVLCAAFTADAQSETHTCLPASADVASAAIGCPAVAAGRCPGFMARAAAATFRSDDVNAVLREPLWHAPLTQAPYVRCCACPLLLLLHDRHDAVSAAPLRCGCGARTCPLRGGKDGCAGRAHAPLNCAAAAALEEVLEAWRPQLAAAARAGNEAAAGIIAAAPGLLPAERYEARDLRADALAAMEADERDVHWAALRDRERRRNAAAAAPIIVTTNTAPAPPGAPPPTLQPEQAVQLRLAPAAAAILARSTGDLDDEGTALLAGAPADVADALRWADALCEPLLTGATRRAAAAPTVARDAAVAAREAARSALDLAEASHGAARTAALAAAGGGGDVAAVADAANAAGAAAADAVACAASARISAETAAAAAARLQLAPESAEAAAAVAAVAEAVEAADDSQMMANVAQGHAASAAAELGPPVANDDADVAAGAADAAAASAAAAPNVAGQGDVAALDAYLLHNARPCRGCGLRVVKVEGTCNTMPPCPRCRHAFCWSCLGPPHEHSYGPCSRAGNRAAVEAAIAKARPDAAAAAPQQAAAMAAADARVAQRRGTAPRRIVAPRAALPRDVYAVPAHEAELATLHLAAEAVRRALCDTSSSSSSSSTHADAANAVAGPLRLLRAMLAAVARAAAAPVPPPHAERDEFMIGAQEREVGVRGAQMRALRLLNARSLLERRGFGEPLHVARAEGEGNIAHADAAAAMAAAAAAAADAPLLATARQVVEALVAANDNGEDDVHHPIREHADVAAAAAACAALFVARSRVLAAAADDRTARPPNSLAAIAGDVGRTALNAWSNAHAALDAAGAAAVCAHYAQLVAALRLPAEPCAAAAPDAAAVEELRGATRAVERSLVRLVHACRAPEAARGQAPADTTTAVADAAAAVAAEAAALTVVERATMA